MNNRGGLGSHGFTTAVSNREPQVFIRVSGQPITFPLDTRATYSVLMEFWGSTSSSSSLIVRVPYYQPHQTPLLNCIFRGIFLTHFFPVIPIHPILLLGKDLPANVGASIYHTPPISLTPGSLAISLLLLQTITRQTFPFTGLPGGSPSIGYTKPLYSQTSFPSCHPITKPYQLHYPGSLPTISPKSQGT